ncbi:MAG TPA: YigZ family protein [Clostridiales bacterium UBA8960]|jgi:uncharacterized YigZ family protein|nr:YigZ family protein [Clostridiales bacterium UBA8960]
MKSHFTLLSEAEVEINISKSRFIGYATPVKDEDEAIVFIEKIKKKHWNATHNVPVYVIGENFNVQRYSDDGEPSGTAGVPILEMLKKEEITNVCIVVTRYFGGVKLGTGGLVRAYTQCAKAALEAGEVVEKRLNLLIMASFDYHYHGKIQNYIMNESGVLVRETRFTDKVEMAIYMDPEFKDVICSQLIELTSNQVTLMEADEHFLTIKQDEVLSAESKKGEVIWMR